MKLIQLFEVTTERSVLSVMGTQKDVYNGYFKCSGKGLKSLNGCPSTINYGFDCSNNKLESLEGAPSVVNGYFYCHNNKLTSLAGINKIVKEINGAAYFRNNPITSNVLGLLRIKGLTEVRLDNRRVEKILNKHLARGDRDIIKCQSELLDTGLEEYAKL